MTEYIIALSGTQQGEQLSFVLALVSALAYAVFAALNKHGADPYFNRGAINIAYSVMAAPFAMFVFPLPEGFLVPILALSFLIHVLYEWLQSAAYSRGAFTLVYPVARGTAPLITALIAVPFFSESLGTGQWIGLLILSGAMVSLTVANLRDTNTPRNGLLASIGLAIGAGFGVAFYTIVDAHGIRITANPFTFLAWFFFLGGFGFPVIAYFRWRNTREKPPVRPLIIRGITGASIAFFSYATLMIATRIGNVSEAAALRETSIIFATIIGVLFLKEKLNMMKIIIIGFIALGAIMVEYA